MKKNQNKSTLLIVLLIYNFVVHNSSYSDLKYYLEMYESSQYKVNLKYRLRKNNEYVIGDNESWVNASELQTAFCAFFKKKNLGY